MTKLSYLDAERLLRRPFDGNWVRDYMAWLKATSERTDISEATRESARLQLAEVERDQAAPKGANDGG